MSDIDDPAIAEDIAKHEAMKAELDAEDGLEPEPPGAIERNAEVYDHARHGPEPQYQPQHAEPQYQPQGQNDPVANFERYLASLNGEGDPSAGQYQEPQHQGGDGYGQAAIVQSHIMQTEADFRGEFADYDQACVHLENDRMAELERTIPNGHQGDVLAHSYGLRSAAELRDAVLNRDRMMVIDHAMRSGKNPAQLYYDLAKERGYRSRVAMGRTQRKGFVDKLSNASGDEFDAAWKVYERMAKREAG